MTTRTIRRLEAINPERIQWCCDDHGIDIATLATETNINNDTLQRTLNQGYGLTFNQLQKVANYFGRGVLFFLEPDPVNEEVAHSAHFRTLANQKPTLSPKVKAIIKRTEEQRGVYLQLLEELSLQDTQSFSPPDVTDKSPEEAADIARKWLRIGHANTFEDYCKALESCGVLVFRSNGYQGKWKIPEESGIEGFSLYGGRCPVIFVRKQNADSRQTFTLAHELGHLLLHKSSSIDDEHDIRSSDGVEREANSFAANFLVPERFLESIHDHERPQAVSGLDDWLGEHCHNWGVSTEVVLLRLVVLGRLEPPVYQAYREWRAQRPDSGNKSGNRSYRYREPTHLFGDKFVRTVLDSLHSRTITITRASRYLDGLKLNDLHKLADFHAAN